MFEAGLRKHIELWLLTNLLSAMLILPIETGLGDTLFGKNWSSWGPYSNCKIAKDCTATNRDNPLQQMNYFDEVICVEKDEKPNGYTHMGRNSEEKLRPFSAFRYRSRRCNKNVDLLDRFFALGEDRSTFCKANSVQSMCEACDLKDKVYQYYSEKQLPYCEVYNWLYKLVGGIVGALAALAFVICVAKICVTMCTVERLRSIFFCCSLVTEREPEDDSSEDPYSTQHMTPADLQLAINSMAVPAR
ncbi:hypothetical protein Ciccas_000652 [Cichlidogyrus casuarinus]|uniref:Uncharacterized protein n=1 Tax=Cichlidogyrus casuarinus TaxID=1844966 RepID=A0ABD2QMC0_9PLAT